MGAKAGRGMNTIFDKRVGRNIRMLRRDKNWTQDQLAAKLQTHGCDITRSTMAKLEVGQRHIYADEIYALKEIFGCSYEQLFE